MQLGFGNTIENWLFHWILDFPVVNLKNFGHGLSLINQNGSVQIGLIFY